MISSIISKGDPFYRKLCLYISQQYRRYSLKEIGAYYGMRGSAVSQSNRRFKERISKERKLKKILGKIIRDINLLNVETDNFLG